jgi:hypothetical protein
MAQQIMMQQQNMKHYVAVANVIHIIKKLPKTMFSVWSIKEAA